MPIYEGKEPYLFISYSHTDNDVIREITQMLDENGCRYWYDTGLHSGNDWNEVIAGKLRDSAACLLLLSPAAASSKYVKNELTFVENMEIPLHPVLIKDYVGASIRALPADIAMTIGRIQMISMERNYYEKLLRGLPSTVFSLSNEADFKIRDGVLEKYIGNGGDVTVPDGVTRIGDKAFRGCTGLTSITIPDGVTRIGDKAFRGCTGLTSITIPDGVTSIGYEAFYGCYKLIEVYNLSSLPITARSYGNGYVGYCAKNVYTATTGKSKLWTDSNGYIFYEDGDTCYLMGYTGSDTALTLPANCNGKNYEIYQYAFDGCTGLTSITIPDSVTSIGSGAFYHCTGLTSITIPDSVTSIGSWTFHDCSSLTCITIPDSVTSIDDGAFDGCSIETATIPAIACSFVNSDDLTTVIITSGENIGNRAFFGCRSLTSITIPDSVTSIGSGAFYHCTGLTSITIPDSVTSIGSWTFHDCSSLTSITIPDSVTSIDNCAFSACIGLTSVTIGNGVTSIDDGAFQYCTCLTCITVPNSVTSIGDSAFYGCSGLTSITFQGAKAQWNAIAKGYDWNDRTGNYTVYCTDGSIFKTSE